MPTRCAHWCTRCGTWWGRTSRKPILEDWNWAGRNENPARSPLRLHLDVFYRDRVLVHGAREGHLMAGWAHHFCLIGNLVHLAVAHENRRSPALDAARRTSSMVRTSAMVFLLACTRCVRDVACPLGSHRTHRTKSKHSQYLLHKPPSMLRITQTRMTILYRTPPPQPRCCYKNYTYEPREGQGHTRCPCGEVHPAPSRRSIKQILPPLRFAVAEHAHEVAAGMQAERPRLPQQLHAGLFRSPAALVIVAGVATGHQVLPCGFAGARPRNHMIQGQLAGSHRAVAILASVPVAHQNILARERPRLPRNPAIFQQADDARQSHRIARGMNRGDRYLFGRGHAFEHQHQGSPRGADVDRFVTGVEHQHWLLQSFTRHSDSLLQHWTIRRQAPGFHSPVDPRHGRSEEHTSELQS